MSSHLIGILFFAALVILVYMSAWFAVALITKRNDVADIAWGLGFGVASTSSFIKCGNYTFTAIFVTILVTVWGLRLSWHIGQRNIKKPEDYRYSAWRESWGKWFIIKSYLQIFIFQGFLMLLIVSPILVIYTYSNNGIFPVVVIGILIWVCGFLFESISDHQLKKFTDNPQNKGRIMNKGLWHYSRHPNYFGEVTQWWAIGLIALPASFGWLGLIGPCVITFLIVKVSGVPMLENKYQNNLEYQAYKINTSMLLPIPRKSRVK